MAQNENISLSLANKIDILNKTQSFDARYGVYDTEEDALDAMALYGLDGRQAAVYSDKVNGKVKLYLYNQVEHKLEPISNFEELAPVALSNNYNDLDNKPNPLTNEDWTLIIDEDNVIWSNITGHTEYFKANGTDRNFVADFDFATIEVVYVNGVAIERDDYLILSENEIEIKENITLLNNTPVAIQGSIFIVEPII